MTSRDYSKIYSRKKRKADQLDTVRILVLTKRQYMRKDLVSDRFGRFREIPLALCRLRYKVTGLCLSYQPRTEGWTYDGLVKWKSINAGRLKVFGIVRYLLEARRLALNSDIIWACSDSIYGIMALLLSKSCRKPFIFDLYDNFEYYMAAKLPVIRQMYRLALRKSPALTVISHPLAELVRGYRRSANIYMLGNAVRKDLFKPLDKNNCRNLLGLPKTSILIGTTGAIEKNRGIENLFEAFFYLKDYYPNLRLVLAGPRNVDIPIDPKIHDLGVLPLSQIPSVINALDVAVICIKNNAFGRYCFPQKTFEIMACDVPLVAADVGSMTEIFAHSPEWLYQPGDPVSLKRAIEHRLRDTRTKYGKQPNWEDMAKDFDNIIKNVLALNKK